MSATENKRSCERRLVRMPATILVPGQVSPAPCVIGELSLKGACLDVDPEWVLPRVFWLRINTDCRLHNGRMIWRQGRAVGVEFSRPSIQTMPPEEPEIIRRSGRIAVRTPKSEIKKEPGHF
jgi:hypothetical protein